MPDVNRVLKTKPLNFVLYYQNYVNLYTIYLDDGYEAKPLYLDIFNESEYEIQLAAPGSEAQRKTKSGCHFYLTVPRNILALDGSESLTSDNNWQVKYVKGSGGRRGRNPNDTLYFSRNTAHTIAAASSENPNLSEISLILNNLQANSAVELRSSEVGLYYGGLTTYKAPIAEALQNVTLANQGYDHTLFIINHLGKKNIPLHAGFAGSNTILNDGGTANQLQLQITNIQDSNNLRSNLKIGQNSRFIMSFESGTIGDKEWALGTEDQVGAIEVNASDPNNWQVEKTANKNEWILTPQLENNAPKKAFLEVGEEIALNITNIQSNHPSGQTKLTIRYEEIPDYWDGDLVCLIEKTPLMYRSPLKATDNNQVLTAVRIKTNFDNNGKSGIKHVGLAVETGKVGIGTTDPKGELHLVGNLVLGNDTNNEKFIMHPRTNGDGDKLYITNDNSDGGWEWDQGIILKRGGNVGMGTSSPSEKLEVNGKIQTNNTLIGSAHSGWAGFSHKDRANETDYALIQNSSGRTILNAASSQDIAFKISNTEKMTLNSSGKLGIGTTSPEEKLHIKDGSLRIDNGQIKSWGTIVFQPNTDKTSGEDLIKFLDKNANLVAIIKDDGKVGIGTTSPTEKLEVNGMIKANSFDKFICAHIKIHELTLNESKSYGRLKATLKIQDGGGGHRVMILVELIDTSRSIEAVFFTPDMVNSNISWETKSCVNSRGASSCELLMYGQNRASDFYGCFVMISLNS